MPRESRARRPRGLRRCALGAAVLATACGSDPERRAPVLQAPASFAAARSAPPTKPARPEGRYLLARLKRPAQLRIAPGGRVVARIATRTEFGSRTVLNVVGRRRGWLRVVATERPNGERGWIPAARATLDATDYAVRIDRSARRLTLLRGSRVLRRFTVAVGRPANPTPVGRYAVTDRLRPARAASPYGCCAVALTGHQTKLVPGWPGGDRLAIHGTQQPESVGRAVSLGCLRARERDIRALMARVPLGTPVFVRA